MAALEELVGGASWPLTLLVKGAEANKDFAKKQALERQSKEFQVWLAQASLRGHSGIYTSLKAPDAVHVRPFRNIPVQDRQTMREQQWYGQWEVIDKPHSSGERERLRWEAIQQARKWEDLDPHWVMQKFRKLPQKACGPDGISYALLKNLPIEGVTDLCHMFRSWELAGRLPEQVCTTLVLLLPKKPDIERPISLTSVLYRTWCKLRWDKLKHWQCSVGHRLPWERSMPGTQVMHVALMRLLKCEVSRAVNRHVISLLIDLQCFYDSVDLASLLELWEPLDFPAVQMNFLYEVYSGPRLLQAEQVTSSPVHCKKGILAGCPMAPLVAKLVLAPVIDRFVRVHPQASVDVWVDDISVDFTGSDATALCREALVGYEELKQGLVEAGLTLSASKTGFLTSSNECKRNLNLARSEGQPRAHDLLKDLGLDSSGGRRRRIGTQQQRMMKGRGRHSKLMCFKLRSRPVRVRIWKTSVHAAVGYGLEAQGIAPQRVRVLQRQLARRGGLQKGGSTDIVFDQQSKLQDPRDTAIERQMKAIHQLMQAWPVAQRGELASAWRVSWKRLQAAAHPWIVAAGPMAALQAYLMEMNWDASTLDDWVRAPTGIMPVAQLNIEYPWPFLKKQLQEELVQQRARRIQELEHCFPMMRRPDWTTYHKVMKHLKGTKRAAIDAWTQGSLRTHTSGGRAVCPLCMVPVSMKHLIWECCYHEKPLPVEWVQQIAANEDAMLWARGMIDSPAHRPTVGVDSLCTTGIFADGWPTRIGPSCRVAIGVKATCKDVRVQNYAVAVVVGQWTDGGWNTIGTCTALAPGKPSEARAWVFGCWLILQALLGRHQINIPCRSGWQALQKGATNELIADLWYNLDVKEWSRLSTLHVPTKLLKGDHGDQRAWLQYQAAQHCAKQRAEQEEPFDLVRTLQENDRWHQQVYEVAADRIEALLQDKQHYMHDKLSTVEADFKVRVRAPKGRIEVMQQLTQRVRKEGQHQWALKGGGVQCSACGMNIKACSTHAEIEKKDGTICAGQRSLSLTQHMQQLVEESAMLPDDTPGHRWMLRASAFSCLRCWKKVPRRCGKDALRVLTALPCQYQQMHEQDLQLRTRIHPSHAMWRRGDWLACSKCGKVTKEIQGKVQTWTKAQCSAATSQQKLRFGPSSSS